MNIAIVSIEIYPYRKGGAEKRTWEIAKRIAKKGHNVHLIGLKYWKGEKEFVTEGVHIHGVNVYGKMYAKKGRRSITQVILFLPSIIPMLLKNRFDIIECGNPTYLDIFFVKFFSLITKSKLIAVVHEVWGDYWYKYLGPIGFFGKIIEKIAVKLPDKDIAVSNAVRSQLIKIRVRENNIKLIPNGININIINKISGNSKKIDVLFVGRLISDKNVDVLIKGIKLCKDKYGFQNIRCYIVGDGPEKEKLIKLSENLNLNKNIKFCGFVEKEEDVIKYMKSSKVFAFPSTREGFGIVIIEANACGLPVIAVNSENSRCVKELIKDGENGFVLNELNENILAEKIILLLKDEKLRNKIGNNGKKVAEKYRWDKISDEVENLYKEIYKEIKNERNK